MPLDGAVKELGREAAERAGEKAIQILDDKMPALLSLIIQEMATPRRMAELQTLLKGAVADVLAELARQPAGVAVHVPEPVEASVGLSGEASFRIGNAGDKPVAVAVGGGSAKAPLHMAWTLEGGDETVKLGPLTVGLKPTRVTPSLRLEVRLFGIIPILDVTLGGAVSVGAA